MRVMNLIKSNYALEQGYTILDLSNKNCKRCLSIVYNEKYDIDYKYYCSICDENMFSFEVSEID